jgi:hypothetical protein
MELGINVFCEKPLCHDISEARAMAAAAKRTGVTTQMGNQGHCAEGYRRVCEYIWAGASVIRWDIPAGPGGPAFKAYWYDGAIPNSDPARKDSAGQVLRTVPNRPQLAAELERRYDFEVDNTFASGGTFYVGTKGVLYSGNYGNRPRLIPDEAHQAFPVPQPQIERVQGSHFSYFLRCCKDRTPTCADFTYAANLTEFLLLGHLALKAGPGHRVEWDGTNLRCPNLPEWDRWVRREYRFGWHS